MRYFIDSEYRGNNSIGSTEQKSSTRTPGPSTNKTTTLLHEYFGYHFDTIDGMFIHPNGDI